MHPAEQEDEEEEGAGSKGGHTSYERTAAQETALAAALAMSSDQLLIALAAKGHKDPAFIPSEVLVTIARSGYGATPRVRDAIANQLTERVVKGLTQFLLLNPVWGSIVRRSSEARTEAARTTLLRIFDTDARVSFAEVNFLTFVNARFVDWLRSQTRFKNEMPSVDGLESAQDEDGNRLSPVEQPRITRASAAVHAAVVVRAEISNVA